MQAWQRKKWVSTYHSELCETAHDSMGSVRSVRKDERAASTRAVSEQPRHGPSQRMHADFLRVERAATLQYLVAR